MAAWADGSLAALAGVTLYLWLYLSHTYGAWLFDLMFGWVGFCAAYVIVMRRRRASVPLSGAALSLSLSLSLLHAGAMLAQGSTWAEFLRPVTPSAALLNLVLVVPLNARLGPSLSSWGRAASTTALGLALALLILLIKLQLEAYLEHVEIPLLLRSFAPLLGLVGASLLRARADEREHT